MRQIFDLTTPLGRRVNSVITAVILFSMVTLVAETHYIASAGALPRWLWTLELVVWIAFGVEYLLRIALAPSPLRYIFSFYGIVDLLAVLGGFANVPSGTSLRLLRLLRVFRVLKLVRGSEAIDRFRAAFRDIADELLVYLSASGVLMFIASVGIYELEHDQPGTPYVGIFDSFYWAVLSLTAGAEGYQPYSAGGKLLSIFIVLIGLGVVAVPSGLLASALYKHDKRARPAEPAQSAQSPPADKPHPTSQTSPS